MGFNKCSHLVQDIDIGGDSACVGEQVKWELLSFPLSFAVNLKSL